MSIYSATEDSSHEMKNVNIAVRPDGNVTLITPTIFKIPCMVDLSRFPFDKQSCELMFGSWTRDTRKLLLDDRHPDKTLNNLQHLVNTSSQWQLSGFHIEHRNTSYSCCLEAPYGTINIVLNIKRDATFYTYVLVLPSILLSTLTLVLFWLPQQNSDKAAFGKTQSKHSCRLLSYKLVCMKNVKCKFAFCGITFFDFDFIPFSKLLINIHASVSRHYCLIYCVDLALVGNL